MPQIDLGQVVGPQGAQGEPGPQGAQGIQGPAGPAATINGVNALTIEAGDNIELSQSGSTTTLSVPTDAAPTEDSTKPVQSGGVAAALNNKPNRNLLDNWYFVGGGSQQGGGQFPINQRGQTSYSGGIYGFDRWQVTGGGQVQISDNGVIATGIGAYGGFQEYIENWENFKEKTVTLSFLITEGTAINNGAYVDILTGESEYTQNVTESGVCSLTVSLPQDITKLQCTLITSANSGYSLTVLAAKLELGPVQTLAHQDADGNWVLNDSPPNFQQELAKCQRYYQLYSSTSIRPSNGNDCRPVMRLATPTQGTIQINQTTWYYNDASL